LLVQSSIHPKKSAHPNACI